MPQQHTLVSKLRRITAWPFCCFWGVWAAALPLCFSVNARRAGGDDATIVKWDAGTGGKLLVMDGHADVVWTLALARQSAVLYSGSGDCTVRAWDTNAGACIQIISEQR